MNEINASPDSRKVLQFGMHDAIVDGERQMDIPTKLIFVADSTERDTLDHVMPGQFVAAYGLTNVWQMNGEGEWLTIK